MDELLLENYYSHLRVEPFDDDKELFVEVNACEFIHLSLNQTNKLINYLVEQLQSVGEPVEILTQK